ncbi:UDP-GalNAc:beta-1,3-N-acetylgalactosaminyltransferase 1-like [Drosophila innubila]|uniref:UDP-GalNAc:beta-1, 3-N-acetylgalactosaminyltransferase 1-like n=1 Tax=Drosophila innubila TaxID=198719 RepID=UPI00148E15A1|nr:UDP-GalNAc:beta-1,3-N-acetylgalactosaminyltransferase 1-like [Drosophila innubila]
MIVNNQWTMMLELHSIRCLILWLNLCLVIYLLMPNPPQILSQQVTTVDISDVYSEKPQQLIDLHNFDYLINQRSCESHVHTLIMIHSAPSNIEKRTVIRQTWGGESVISVNSSLRLFFLFGAVEDADQQSLLREEHALHGDLLQGNFLDAYFNLTYKHVMALKWFANHCKQAQLLLKVDDDIYLNTPLLLHHMQLPLAALPALLHQQEKLLLCAKQENDRVLRSYSSKWRVSFREYSDRFYPPFCPGFAVVYSRMW